MDFIVKANAFKMLCESCGKLSTTLEKIGTGADSDFRAVTQVEILRNLGTVPNMVRELRELSTTQEECNAFAFVSTRLESAMRRAERNAGLLN
jgi:hypothetical protein